MMRAFLQVFVRPKISHWWCPEPAVLRRYPSDLCLGNSTIHKADEGKELPDDKSKYNADPGDLKGDRRSHSDRRAIPVGWRSFSEGKPAESVPAIVALTCRLVNTDIQKIHGQARQIWPRGKALMQ